MTWQALAITLGLLTAPALAEPYRPLPRYPESKVRQRAASSRAVQKLHQDSLRSAPFDASRERSTAETEDEVHLVAIPPLPERLHRESVQGVSSAVTALPDGSGTGSPQVDSSAFAASELKLSVSQGGAEGQVLVLVDAPPGARIELTLDEGGRLLDVRSTSQRSGPPP